MIAELILVLLILIIIGVLGFYASNMSLTDIFPDLGNVGETVEDAIDGERDENWCDNLPEGEKCGTKCALWSEISDDSIALTYCNDDHGFDYVFSDRAQANCMLGQGKVSCKKFGEKDKDYKILKNAVVWNDVKNKEKRNEYCKNDFGEGWVAADLPATGSGVGSGFGKGYCVPSKDFEQLKADKTSTEYCTLNETENKKCYTDCITTDDSRDKVNIATYCNKLGEEWFPTTEVANSGCESNKVKIMCENPQGKNIKKWKNDNLTWVSNSVGSGNIENLNATCKRDYGEYWEHYALRKNGDLFVGYCINNTDKNIDGNPGYVKTTTQWVCKKEGTPVDWVEIDKGHASIDADWACNDLKSVCDKNCKDASRIEFKRMRNEYGNYMSVAENSNFNNSTVLIWPSTNEDSQFWGFVGDRLVNKRGKYLSVINNENNNGSWVVISDFKDDNSQKWYAEEDGHLRNGNGRYLAISGNYNVGGTRLILWERKDENGQLWKFEN